MSFKAVSLVVGLSASSALGLPTHQLLGGPGIAAHENVSMPFTGLGEGDHAPVVGQSREEFQVALNKLWFGMGGVRVDGATSYGDNVLIARAVNESSVNRDDLWITSKVGPGGYKFPMGYEDALAQTQAVLQNYSTTYLDLLLVHEPRPQTPFIVDPVDPACIPDPSTHHVSNETECRLRTYRALVELWQNGTVRAIGVSNYNITHIQEIEAAGLPLPAVNQVPTNPLYPQQALYEYCEQRSIHIQAYHSLGGIGDSSVLSNPTIKSIAAEHNRSAAQVILNYQVGRNISVNPGFSGPGIPGYQPLDVVKEYMEDNMGFFDFELAADEVAQIAALGNQ